MKSLLERYNEAPATSDVGKVRETVATVADGDEGVNFFDQTGEYQEHFIERASQNKIVTQATGDDETNGKFKTKALLFYAEQVSARAKPDEGLHFYNQRQSNTWYSTRNAPTPGVTQTYQI
jgi:hypothetical protein